MRRDIGDLLRKNIGALLIQQCRAAAFRAGGFVCFACIIPLFYAPLDGAIANLHVHFIYCSMIGEGKCIDSLDGLGIRV